MVLTSAVMIRQAGEGKLLLSVSSKKVLNVSVCHKLRFEVSSNVPLCHGHGTIQSVGSKPARDHPWQLLSLCKLVSTRDWSHDRHHPLDSLYRLQIICYDEHGKHTGFCLHESFAVDLAFSFSVFIRLLYSSLPLNFRTLH